LSIILIQKAKYVSVHLILINPWPCIGLIRHSNEANKRMYVCKSILYYEHSWTPKCFCHSFGHPEGVAFTKDGYIKILQKFVNQCTNVK